MYSTNSSGWLFYVLLIKSRNTALKKTSVVIVINIIKALERFDNENPKYLSFYKLM